MTETWCDSTSRARLQFDSLSSVPFTGGSGRIWESKQLHGLLHVLCGAWLPYGASTRRYVSVCGWRVVGGIVSVVLYFWPKAMKYIGWWWSEVRWEELMECTVHTHWSGGGWEALQHCWAAGTCTVEIRYAMCTFVLRCRSGWSLTSVWVDVILVSELPKTGPLV